MKHIVVLIIALGMSACTSTSDKKDSSVVTIGNDLSARKFSNIYFSGQPQEKDFKILKKQGFALVVNLRDPKEHDEANEKKQVNQTGIEYVNIPFASSASLDDPFIEEVTKEVLKHRQKGKILIHCSSGNRAGVWAGGHFYKDHGYTKQKSIEISQQLGVTSRGALDKLKLYLDAK